jgi:hypothetical protein
VGSLINSTKHLRKNIIKEKKERRKEGRRKKLKTNFSHEYKNSSTR